MKRVNVVTDNRGSEVTHGDSDDGFATFLSMNRGIRYMEKPDTLRYVTLPHDQGYWQQDDTVVRTRMVSRSHRRKCSVIVGVRQ